MGQNSGLLSSLTDWNSTLAGYADSISSGVVMPIALTVLALFMVLELYNFTQTIAMEQRQHSFYDSASGLGHAENHALPLGCTTFHGNSKRHV